MAQIFDITNYDHIFVARTSPAEWQRILAFRSLPRFGEALKTYADLMPHYFADNMLLSKVVTEAWRFEMLVYTLYLYDTRDPANPASGLTLSNLQRICAEQKCASKGRVLAILSLMRVGGFLRQQKSETDSRIKHLVPSKKFIDIVEGWNQRIFQIIDSVLPEGQLAARHLAEPRYGWNMRRRGVEGLLAGFKLLDPFPEVNHFVSSDGGWMFLLHCVGEALRGHGTISPLKVDLVSFGKQFSVSRSHLRRLLETAYERGLLQVPPRNGAEIVLSEITVAAFLNCMALELDFYMSNAVGTAQTVATQLLAKGFSNP